MSPYGSCGYDLSYQLQQLVQHICMQTLHAFCEWFFRVSVVSARFSRCTLRALQNVRPEKLFTQERAIKQLLEIIDRTTMTGNGKFYAWDGQEVPW